MEHGDIVLLLMLPQIHRLIMSNANLKQLGFTKTQLIIMTAVFRKKKMNMTQVANYISSSKEQATRAVAQLVDDGYLERSGDPQNRTYVCVSLTEKGQQTMTLCQKEFLKNLDQRLTECLTDDERTKFRETLGSLLRLMDKIC